MKQVLRHKQEKITRDIRHKSFNSWQNHSL